MIGEYSLSVICPVWNEIELFPDAFREIYDFLAREFAEFEFIIVESGSTDGTWEACDEFAEGRPEVVVIHEGARNGAGAALKLGYGRARMDLVWTVWADLPFALTRIHEALPLLKDHDAVLSYRSEDRRPVYRRIQSITYNFLGKLLLGLRVKHVNSAFKVFHRRIVEDLELKSNGWLVEAEITYRLQNMGASCAEIPVPLVDRTQGTSSVTLWTAASIFLQLIRFSLADRFGVGA